MEQQDYKVVWEDCLRILQDLIPPVSFRTWFAPIKAVSLENGRLVLGVPTNFFPEYIDAHFLGELSTTLRRVIGPNARLGYKVSMTKEEGLEYPSTTVVNVTNPPTTAPIHNMESGQMNPWVIPGISKVQVPSNLNGKYSFDNFVEGECNRLARAAGVEIARKPGYNAFNPFYIYGGPGMGKTHLAQAIGIAIKEAYPEKNVVFVSCHSFMSQYVDAVQGKKVNDFLHFYQSMDVLIIDDVHEFSERHGTQNAYFQIFNYLHNLGKQLVMTSDRPSVDLQGVEQRLVSRFKWGLTAELTAPDYDTRLAILKSKTYNEGISLPEDVLQFIAGKVVGNVRELEGALYSLMAKATLVKKQITLEVAQQLINSIVSAPQDAISVMKIKNVVCSYFGITDEMFSSSSRKRELVQARQIAMYLSRKHTNTSLDCIGSQIGGKNHATVLYACQTVNNMNETDRNFRRMLGDIEKELKKTK
ncbi:MAG: chromosomal replication initiator protein DnaA [Bacteroidales bacterium]|nr:chromosomal replication initiator protein DnaA [Bacteroidales bacterium]